MTERQKPVWRVLTLAALLMLSPVVHAEINRIYMIHLSHMDVGFTDHPAVTREMQKMYLDQAIDTCVKDKDFRWTAESLLAVSDWWQTASPGRQKQLLLAVNTGRIAIAALPFNNAPYLDAAEWRQVMHWIPDDLWNKFHPSVAVQDDVNGFPRAGAMHLLHRGVHRLFMGLNSDSGGPPWDRPTAFWWRMPDGQRMLVYLGDSYPMGYSYFHESDWRRGPVPHVAETEFRQPREGDFFQTDEASLRKAHGICRDRIVQLERRGYRYSSVILPFSNQWRMDNDPPFPPIARFVAAWNRLGLKPEIRLLTAAEALAQFEKESGAMMPEYSGEWPDWWANGAASGPREVSASRSSKAYLRALESPVFAPLNAQQNALIEEIRKDLCLFDEHTWGGANSVSLPDSLDTLGQFNEKARLAYRSQALAQWLVSERARVKVQDAATGLYVINPNPIEYTGWVSVAAPAIRVNAQGIDHYEAGLQPWSRPRTPADLSPENDSSVFQDTAPRQIAKFWVDKLPPACIRPLRGSTAVAVKPDINTDERGWPISARWSGMQEPLFTEGIGDFLSARPVGFAPRWILTDMAAGKPGTVEQVPAVPGIVAVAETGHTILYTQTFTHPSLKRGTRILEIWKAEPRARLTINLYRLSNDAPESFYVAFPFPVKEVIPILSEGGMDFTPYEDQLPGSCRDYFATDGWAHYATKGGHWLWASRDAPLLTFHQPEIWTRRKTASPTARLLAIIFNNFWYTNFVGNEHGAMQFQFDLLWRPALDHPAMLAESLALEPIVVQQ